MNGLSRFSFCWIASLMLMSCGGTWRVQDHAAAQATNAPREEISTIERQHDRNSPSIKTFRHFELGIDLESGGSRHNDAFARTRVETPPGNVQVGVVLPWNHRSYYPVVEFNAEPGRDYFVTWVCLPYPFVAITDANSSKIVALDSYCPGCDAFIGATVTPNTECLGYLQPPWMKPDEKSYWLSWLFESSAQFYRNLCYAAEHGVLNARLRLGVLYDLGIYGLPEDPVRAYVWYKFAASSGNAEAVRKGRRLETTELTPAQLEEASNLVNNWEGGQCAKELLGSLPQKYEIRFPD